MAWSILKKAINDAIKTNGNQEITGSVLQNTLGNIVSSIGENATFAGIATPGTNPGTPDGPVFYITFEKGDYANFGQIRVNNGELVILKWDTAKWNKYLVGDFAKLGYDEGREIVPSNVSNSNDIIINAKVGDIIYYTVDEGDRDSAMYLFREDNSYIPLNKPSNNVIAKYVCSEEFVKLRYYITNVSNYADNRCWFLVKRKNAVGVDIIESKENISKVGGNFGAIFGYNTTNPTLEFDFENKILSWNTNRSYALLSNKSLGYTSGEGSTLFDFDGNVRAQLNMLLFNVTEKKFYFIGYDKAYKHPEFDESGTRVNYYIGHIIYNDKKKQWYIDFAFDYITINGVNFYGTLDDVNSRIEEVNKKVEKYDESFEAVLSQNMFDKTSYSEGYYGSDGKNFISSNIYWTSSFIEVEHGKRYKRSADTSFFVYAYDEEKNPVIVHNDKPLWSSTFEDTIIPEGVRYIRFLFTPSKLDTIMFGLYESDFSNYIPYTIKLMLKKGYYLGDGESGTGASLSFDNSRVGNLVYKEIGDTDYSHIILYGQSLSMGWQCSSAITTTPLKNCFMVGSSPMITKANDGSKVLSPLIAKVWPNGGEQPIVALTNTFAKQYNRFVDRNQKFIGTNCGEGGQSIEKLSKECTNGTNYYTTEFLKTINSAKDAVEAEGKTISCSAIVYMQGEYNYTNLTGAGLTPGTDATNDKDTYKAYLLTLKNNMQADIMAKYGQSEKPLFFIYTVCGSYILQKNMPINMAQVEFAMENDDVFLLNPTYFTPDYGGGHLSTNGYRWYGETIGKALCSVFIDNMDCKPIMPKEYKVSNDTISIYCYVPVKPLVVDTWTKEEIVNYGFRVYKNNSEVAIVNVSVNDNVISIKTIQKLDDAESLEITYAGNGRSGAGNVRDSDDWHSLYTYWDDTNDIGGTSQVNYRPKDMNGNYIFGKPYPMYNWLTNFYKKLV